ncbi:MAG TPA: choice-of-anchor D domain-containing protein [Kofleriaceae bacterium]|jgi:hypothetical protein
MGGLQRFVAVAAVAVALSACQTADPGYSTTSSNLVTSPTPNVTFPTTQVGQTSAPITIQISPVGNTYNTITNIAYSCSDFSVQATLPGYAEKDCEPIDPCAANSNIQQCQPRANVACGPGSYTTVYNFTATFHPNSAVSSSCPLTIVANTGTYQVTLNGTGAPPPLSGDVIPATAGFGGVRINTASSSATITLRNTGGATLTVGAVTVNNGVFHIVSGPTGGTSLAPGQTQPFGITCNPTVVGGQSATLSVPTNYANLTASLSCTGIDSNLDISPSPASIAQARVGEPQMTTLNLVNSGGAAMSIENVTVTGGDIMMMSTPTPGTNLAPGASAQTSVKFMATAAGDTSGTLTVTYDGGKTRQTEIAARAVNTSMSVSPSGSVDLGPVCVGQTAKKTFTVVANDQGPFKVMDVSGIGDAFTYTSENLPAAVQPNGANMYMFDVTAAPTAEGAAIGTVTVATDIPNGTPQQVDLTVTGLAEGVTGTPSQVYLGGVDPGMTTVGQNLTITNCSSGPVTISNPRIEGDDAGEFSIVTFPNGTIDAQGSAQWLVIAKPTSVGEKNATFVADYDGGGQVMIALTGDGLGMAEDPTDTTSKEASYYSCSVGGSVVGVWPLALAFGFMARRRRARR